MTTQKRNHQVRDSILEAWARLRHTKLVSDELRLPMWTVQYHLKRSGLFVPQGRVGACHKNHETVAKMAAAGNSLGEIARAIGTVQHRVKAYILRWGLERKPFEQAGPR